MTRLHYSLHTCFIYAIMFVFTVMMGGCGDTNKSGIDFNAFHEKVRRTAGDGAIDCGIVDIGADRSQTNCCVANNYKQSVPAYAIYKSQGIDSDYATGVCSNATGSVTFFGFDSDPSGSGSANNGEIRQNICMSPTILATACTDSVKLPFTCGSTSGWH